jgi:hypothetical protein
MLSDLLSRKRPKGVLKIDTKKLAAGPSKKKASIKRAAARKEG